MCPKHEPHAHFGGSTTNSLRTDRVTTLVQCRTEIARLERLLTLAVGPLDVRRVNSCAWRVAIRRDAAAFIDEPPYLVFALPVFLRGARDRRCRAQPIRSPRSAPLKRPVENPRTLRHQLLDQMRIAF